VLKIIRRKETRQIAVVTEYTEYILTRLGMRRSLFTLPHTQLRRSAEHVVFVLAIEFATVSPVMYYLGTHSRLKCLRGGEARCDKCLDNLSDGIALTSEEICHNFSYSLRC
jgi:hypothetical protein